MKERLASTTASISRVIAAIREVGHSAALLEELGRLEQEQNELRAKLFQFETQQGKGTPEYSLEEVMSLGDELADRLLSESYREQEITLRGFVKEIRARRLGGRGSEIVGEIVLYPPGEKEGEIHLSI